jgi:carboxypeptidase Q
VTTYARILALLCLLPSILLCAHPGDTPARPYEDVAMRLYTDALAGGKAYAMLAELTGTVGARLSGSPAAGRAIEWGKRTMEGLGFDSVWLEKVMVPHWVRGPIEEAFVEASGGRARVPLSVCALGGSVGTPDGAVTGEVVEVQSFEELRAMGAAAKGKIIFFNRPMDPRKLTTFEAYGGAVDQRGSGAVEAARAGGIAAIVRSMTTRRDDEPHTGAMHYNDSIPKVPAAAISIIDAGYLDSLLTAEKRVRVSLRLSCETLPDVEQANVIGELRGADLPGEVLVVGGHLDSWDKGTGAHDDGTGCVQAIEALRLIRAAGLRPKRTIRAVLFINEENGLRGGTAYAAVDRGGEKHILALESDAGGLTPRGFGVSTDAAILARDSGIVGKIASWAYLFEPIGADRIGAGGGGSDISPLGRNGVPCVGLRVDSHRYFDYHHSENDTFDKVNDRELHLGAAAEAVLLYVIAQEGL